MSEKSKIELWSTVVQTAASVATLGFALWAFFFSSLSQKLEESFRTDLNLAKIELIEAKKEKLRVEVESEALAAATQKLSAEKSRLSEEITAAQERLTTVQQDRAKYATSTLALVKPQFAAMIIYEVELNSKVAEICSRYNEHLAWLRSAKQLVALEAKLNSDDIGLEQLNVLSNEIEALREKTRRFEFWLGIPSPPQLDPTRQGVVWNAQTIAFLNADNDPDRFDQSAHKWLLEQILDPDGKRAMTGRQFIEHAKQYELLRPLLPEERQAFFTTLDGFLTKYPKFRDVKINLTTPAVPDARALVALGKVAYPLEQDFRKSLLAYLKSVGITS